MRILFAIPGLHRYDRGAEVALISIATELAKKDHHVTLIGSGPPRPHVPYTYLRAASVGREHFENFPSVPPFRNEYAYEEFSFIPGLLQKYRPEEYDITLTCGFPFTNWVLRRSLLRGRRPPHIYITENGDWPALVRESEYRFFGCEGLVCTNPDFYDRNKYRWNSKLIPNGIYTEQFSPGSDSSHLFGFSREKLIVLMVSALIPSKRVITGIEAVSKIPDAHLVVAGDGPLRDYVDAAAREQLHGRFTRLSLSSHEMPALYRSVDVFLHLSKEESFGNVFLEAMASGLPIVGHDTPRLRWIVGDHEFLLDTSDAGAIAENICAASKDTVPRRTQRREAAAAFSWPRIASMYQDFLNDVIDKPRNSR